MVKSFYTTWERLKIKKGFGRYTMTGWSWNVYPILTAKENEDPDHPEKPYQLDPVKT